MPEELAPGVFIEEAAYRSSSIGGVPTWSWPLAAILVAFSLARLRSHRRVSG